MAYNNYSEEDPKAMWNMDNERLKVVNQLMIMFEGAMIEKNFEEIYIYLRSFKRNALPAIDEKGKPELEKDFDAITQLKNKMNTKQSIVKNFSEYYYRCEMLFQKISDRLVEGGFFFRKSEYDPDAL